ncbi:MULTISPECIES: anti-phage ZorAB system protein ZorA [unclassified Microbulbifer]|uniref:anti-phage ZorAB system protein ZorA n=1 Tax=unclassified Microbulbifer TaxID=2619833 RepID=UPI0027E41D1C|nr:MULTISPECIES: anti-phage ZorAB system protein ZorA [unclassified Microbulbifer]
MTEINFFELLIPDFFAALTLNSAGIAAWFCMAIVLVLVISVLAVIRHFWRYRRRMRTLHRLLDGQSREQLAFKRRETRESAKEWDPKEVGPLWQEFDETLVLSPDSEQLFNTYDASHFFNNQTLASGLTGSRLLAAAPSFLVAIGVLGTFVGLTVGLNSLNLDSRSDIDTLRNGIDGLIAGAAMAFMTSVWGVAASLILNLFEKFTERQAIKGIVAIQHRVDFLYPRIPAEQSLVAIAEHSQHSREALQELHERIGDRLQEAVQGMSDSMQEALTNTLNSIMGPAIDSLVNHSQDQSTTALESLVTRFMKGMGEAGRSQSAMMDQAAARMEQSVGEMSGKLANLTEHLEEQQQRQREATDEQLQVLDQQVQRMAMVSNENQQAMVEQFQGMLAKLTEESGAIQRLAQERENARNEQLSGHVQAISESQSALLEGLSRSVTETQQQSSQMAEQHEVLMSKLEVISAAMDSSSQHMDSTANQLGLLGTKVESANRVLGDRIDGLAQRLAETSEHNQRIAQQFQEQLGALTQLQQQMSDAVAAYRDAAHMTTQGFSELERHQKSWLESVRDEFTRLGHGLAQQVTGVEEQASKWLDAYAAQVNQQVTERMQEWNNQSVKYATEMSRLCDSLSSVLDELEARVA